MERANNGRQPLRPFTRPAKPTHHIDGNFDYESAEYGYDKAEDECQEVGQVESDEEEFTDADEQPILDVGMVTMPTTGPTFKCQLCHAHFPLRSAMHRHLDSRSCQG